MSLVLASIRPSAPPLATPFPAVGHGPARERILAIALELATERLERAVAEADAMAIQDAALALTDLAEIHALPDLKRRARALLGWHYDERQSGRRLRALVDGVHFAVAGSLTQLARRARAA